MILVLLTLVVAGAILYFVAFAFYRHGYVKAERDIALKELDKQQRRG